ncbi:unnamed protein product [Malus baccata var. baccata]
MAKRSFKLKFPRVIPLIQLCRPNTTPLYRQFTGCPPLTLPAPPPSTPEDPSVKCHVSSKPTKSLGCGSCRSRSSTRFISDCNVEIKSSADNDELNHNYNNYNNNNLMSPISETENYYRKKRNKKRKTKKKKSKLKTKPELSFINISSGNWFSGEFDGGEEISEESGTPIYSSRSFSTEFSLVMDTIGQKISGPHKQSSKKRPNSGNYDKVRRSNSDSDSKKSAGTTGGEFGKIKTVLRPMRACRGEEEKVRESVAVVKKSEDPFEDFRRSMMEMIMEKQIFEAKELEELLHCFLTLNSRHYQDVIVEAFSEIWELLFSDPSDQVGNLN